MAGFKLDQFFGLRPRLTATKLARGEAQTALNLKLGSGDLEPIPDQVVTQAVAAGRDSRSIYLFDNAGSPLWFEWDDYVDVVRGPVKDDSLERTYYSGDKTGNNAPKLTTIDLADLGGGGPYPESWLYIGVPAPVDAPTVEKTALPEDVLSGDRFASNFKSDELAIDLVKWTVYPGSGSRNQTWRLNASALGSIGFDVLPGTSFRVVSIINSNKVTIESSTEPGITMRTLNNDKSSVNDWHPMDEQGSTQEAEFLGWRVPVGMQITIPGHALNIGDVIVVSAINIGMAFSSALTTDFYEQDWDVESLVPDPAASYTHVTDAAVSASAVSGITPWTITGSFYYDVDRAASDSSELEDRSYVYTYVNSLGEEGPPSPPSTATALLDGQSVLISDMALPPTVGYDITDMRLYRTNSTEAGTEYQFVKEFAISQTTRDEVLSVFLGEVLSSTTWDPPPRTMLGLTTMPNGMMVGFDGKQVFFCEPYFPHAWPPEYDQAVDYNIVGLAAFGNSVAVLTEGWPYIITGSHPRNANVRPIKFNQACLNKESIATDGDKVYYASPDGIVEISVNGISVATEALMDKKDWAAYSPETLVSEFFEGRYYGFYDFDVSGVAEVIAAEISGTIVDADEGNIVEGGRTIIITLTNDIWVAAGSAFNNQRQAIIDGLTASTSQTLGWNNEIRDTELLVTDVVRTSDLIVTITLPGASGYAITSDEIIQGTIPAAALLTSNAALLVGSTFTIPPQTPSATVTLSGTIDGALESAIVTGGDTVIITLTNDTWVAAGTLFDAERQGIIDGLAAATNEIDGWNDNVPQEIVVTDVVRTSDLIVTITLPAIADYSITENESVTATIPHTALVTQQDVNAVSSNSVGIIATGIPSALFSGTIVVDGVTENEIVAGAETIIITLTNDTWAAAGTGPIGSTQDTQDLIDAIIAASSPTDGWNNVVSPGIETADLVRTSPTVATITLDAEAGYSIASNETISCIIPAVVLVTSGDPVTVANTFAITAQTPVTCVLSGTASASIAENDIVDGGKTIILTLSDDTWKVAGSGPIGDTADTQALIDGISAATSPANGWNNEIRDGSMTPAHVVRTSDTVATITIAADAQYNIASLETITATVPAAALTISASPVVASPTFTIAVDVPASVALTGTITTSDANDVVDGGPTIILTLSDDEWVASGATFNAQRQAIIDGCTAAASPALGWNAEVRDGTLGVANVVRTSSTVVTITLPATPLYAIASTEVITVTVPAAAILVETGAVVAAPTFSIEQSLVTEVMVSIAPRVIATTREAYSAHAENSFSDWTEQAVDADTAGTAQYCDAAIEYVSDEDRWIIVSRKHDVTYSIRIFESDDDGATWAESALFNETSPVFTGSNRQVYYHDGRDVLVVSATSYPNLIYSLNGGASWAEDVTPFDLLSTFGGYSGPRFVYGGTNYIYATGQSVYDAGEPGYDYYGVRSPSLATASDVSNAWEEFELFFDSSISDNMTPWPVSANGKVIYVAGAYQAANDYDLYICSVPHGSTTETYIGKIAAAYKGSFSLSAASPTKIVMLDSSGYLLTVDVGDEGTIGDWDAPTGTSDRITTDSMNFGEIIWDPGDVAGGKEGLGFVAVGKYNSSDTARIYTSPNGVDWTLSETLTLATADIEGVASKYVADTT